MTKHNGVNITTTSTYNFKGHQVWKNLETFFRNNKDVKAIKIFDIQIVIGNSTTIEYYSWIKTIVDFLDNIEVVVPKKNPVMYTINYSINYLLNLTI